MPQSIIRYKSIVLAFTFGTLMALAAFAVVNYYERLQLKQQFDATFSDKTTGLEQAIIAIEKVLVATKHVIAVYPNLTSEQFNAVVNEELLAGTSIYGVEWAPKTPLAEKSQLELHIQNSGVFDFMVREVAGSSTCQTDLSDHLFPVVYAAPSDHIGHELGLNVASDCTLQQAMEVSVKNDMTVVTPFEDDNGEIGIRLLLPVKGEQELAGYIIGLVMINELIDSLWGDLTSSTNHRLTIYADIAQTKKLYDSKWLANCDQSQACIEPQYQLTNSAQIPFANQLWSISFNQADLKSKEDYFAYLAAFLVLLITVTLSYYLYKNINHIQWANELVEEKTRSLRFQASHDQLTQLLNKTSLFNQLQSLTKLEKKQKFVPFSILFIDLDHFKKINDTMGHLVGDQILQLVSQRIKANSRPTDNLFRFGGDEFVIVLQGLSSDHQVVAIAERYLTALKKPYHIKSQSYQIGASVGAFIIEKSNTSAEDILRNSDIAMYSAKESGRGKVVLFQRGMYDQVMDKHKLETDLIAAISSDEFELYYQPIVDSDSKVNGFEALARWRHKHKGVLPPSEFISQIENSTMVKPFGELVATKAIKKLSSIYELYRDNCPYISINISPLQLLDSDIVELIIAKLAHFNLPGHLLAIELTESALIENHNVVRAHLTQLRQAGVKIYLDDFGTGYSSLSLLQHFPIDKVKIDRSFVAVLTRETTEASNLIQAIISMANALNMKVIAEGIENRSTMDRLIGFHCHAFQGYYFAKPMPEKDIVAYLTTAPAQTHRRGTHTNYVNVH